MGKSQTAEYRVRETEINENNMIMTERMCKRKKITKEYNGDHVEATFVFTTIFNFGVYG